MLSAIKNLKHSTNTLLRTSSNNQYPSLLQSVFCSSPIGTDDPNSYLKVIKIKAQGLAEANQPELALRNEKYSSTKLLEPLEQLLGSLCACEYSTALYLARNQYSMKISRIAFKNVEGHIDASNFLGKQNDLSHNKFSKVKIEVEIDTESDQKQIDILKESVAEKCLIHNMLKMAGVQIETSWRKI